MFLSYLLAALHRWRIYRQTVTELSNLGDRDLQDLGISRCDIRRIASEAANTAH